MSEPTGKGWKDALLTSGRPLETSVARRVLEVDGLRPRAEYEFDRFDPSGQPVIHSVDLLATWEDLGRDLHIDLLIESKFRQRPKTWVYRKSEAAVPGGVSSTRFFQTTEDLVSDRYFNRKGLSERVDHEFLLGSKPVEIHDPERNSKFGPCDDGGRQLAYAVASRMAEAALETLRDGQFRFVLPITVTTANLRVMKSNPTMEEVEAAKSLDDLVEKADLVVSRFPTRDLEKHVLHRLTQLADLAGRAEVNDALLDKGIQGLPGLARRLASQMDGTYIVVPYERLAEVAGRAIDYCVSETHDHFRVHRVGGVPVSEMLRERFENASS